MVKYSRKRRGSRTKKRKSNSRKRYSKNRYTKKTKRRKNKRRQRGGEVTETDAQLLARLLGKPLHEFNEDTLDSALKEKFPNMKVKQRVDVKKLYRQYTNRPAIATYVQQARKALATKEEGNPLNK